MSPEPLNLLHIQLLGGFRIWAGDSSACDEHFHLRKARNLVKLLVLAPNHRLHREQVIEQLWFDADPDLAANDFYQALYMARKVLSACGLPGQEILRLSENVLCLSPHSKPWIDIEAFENAAELARKRRDLLDYQAALDLYTGDLLPDAPYEEWTIERREALRRERLNLLLELADLHESRQETQEAMDTFHQAAGADPLCEEAQTGLMRLNALTGHRSAALAQYETFRRVLQKDLEIEPDPETTALYDRIRTGELCPVPKADATMPVFSGTLGQLHLPNWLNPFIGRTDLLEEIRSRLENPTCRLLTLVGPGGSGKTRLAVEAASRQAAAFPDGVYFVPLASLQSIHSIPPAVAQSLALTFHDKNDLRQQLHDFLREKAVLLVLDNFEHLVEGAVMVAELLQSAPRIKILVTSRGALNLQGECLLPVLGMDYPEEKLNNPSSVLQYNGVKLFLEAVQRLIPGYQLNDDDLVEIGKICRQVEGIPLAILMVAVWMRVLSPAQISTQIAVHNLDFFESKWHDLPVRQRSLRTVFDQSWCMLSDREQLIFVGVAIFCGAFTLDAAKQVSQATLLNLADLVDLSLLRHTSNGRYEMHALLRWYGLEKLNEQPDCGLAILNRHTAYYSASLQRWAVELKGSHQIETLAEMDGEIDDVFAAWNRAIDHKQVERLEEGMDGLGLYLNYRCRDLDGCEAFQRAVNLLESLDYGQNMNLIGLRTAMSAWSGTFELINPRPNWYRVGKERQERNLKLIEQAEQSGLDVRQYRAFAMQILGKIHNHKGDLEGGKEKLLAGLKLYQELNMHWEVIRSLISLTKLTDESGHFYESICYAQEGLDLCKILHVPLETIRLQANMANLLLNVGRSDEAERLLIDCEEKCRRQGILQRLPEVLLFFSLTQRQSGKFCQSVASAEEGLAISLRFGDLLYQTLAYLRLGEVYTCLGQCEPARTFLQKSLLMLDKTQYPWGTGVVKHYLGIVEILEGHWDDACRLIEQSVVDLRNLGKLVRLSNALADLSLVQRKLGNKDAAHDCLREAMRITNQFSGVTISSYIMPAVAYDLASREPERALEIIALVSRFPNVASMALFGLIGKWVAEAVGPLSPEVVTAAQQRGRELDLQSTLQKLLAEFESEEIPHPVKNKK